MNHTHRARAARHLRLLRKRRQTGRVRRAVLAGLTVVTLLVMLTVPAVAAGSVGPLPAVTGLSTSNLNQDTLIYDRHGTLLADIGLSGDHRIVVPLNYISPYLIRATIDVEDHTFYKNSGIDLASIARAAIADYSHHHIAQGGSTITQQLVKQVFIGPNPPPTLQRKLKEAILAVEINGKYSKSQVLSMYLNTIYYGSQSYGVEAAARSFFHTNARDLTLSQASMLAGLPQAPTGNSPLINPQQAKRRQAEVLQAMVTQHDITQAQAEQALAAPLQVYPPANVVQAPHFVDYVLQYMEKTLHMTPNDHKGYRVTTSLDLNLQHLAEQTVHDQIARFGDYYNFHDAALVSLDPKTGEVLAMVGGNDYYSHGGAYNMATTNTRQPGSSFKLFTYTAAIDSQRLNMTSPILDQPMIFPLGGGSNGLEPWAPQNYDRRYHGTVPLKVAMGNSLNIPAVKVELMVGIPSVLDVARRMGVTSLTAKDDTYGKSLTLGGYGVPPIDMATGAATLATLGVRHRPAPVLQVVNGLGQPLYGYEPKKNEYRAISQQTAFIIDSIVSDDRNRCMEFGCGGDLTLPGRHVGAKTGTTQDFRDNWTVGFTPSLATAVWVGNPDYTPLSHNSTGIVGAAPIWHRFMMQALANTPDEWYPVPNGVDARGGNYFLPGTEYLPPTLAQSWPTCRFRSYTPYSLTDAQQTVGGLPCVLGYMPPGMHNG
ncbi:MAG TPA: transglycosylase domain-containing protein [Candidatus Limnocylindrales bacterium]|nr:transglycosylase domain-containing protein [Candidatus Limnocylindrales bacterium]